MMPSSELIKILRTGAQGLDYSVRFLILDACDRLERQIRDNELLMNKIVELRTSKDKTNADRIRAMSDEELAHWICKRMPSCASETCPGAELCNATDGLSNGLVKWLQQPSEEV